MHIKLKKLHQAIVTMGRLQTNRQSNKQANTTNLKLPKSPFFPQTELIKALFLEEPISLQNWGPALSWLQNSSISISEDNHEAAAPS